MLVVVSRVVGVGVYVVVGVVVGYVVDDDVFDVVVV